MKILKTVKSFLLNLVIISIPSFLILFLLLEFFVFQFIYRPSEYPKNMYDDQNKIIKYIPYQEGNFRRLDEINSIFKINANGWNSIHDRYSKESDPGKGRIAFIGDSYIFAVQVDVDKNVTAILENKLNDEKYNAEVYNFGVSGIPLSQYLHMIRYIISNYSPDLIIVNIVHNDFMESIINYKAGHRYSNSLMKLQLLDNGKILEIAPSPYKQPLWEKLLVSTNTFRALYQRANIAPKLAFIKNFLFNSISKREVRYEANININEISYEKIEYLTDYIFREMKELSVNSNTHLLLIMNPAISNIYENNIMESKANQLNRIGAKIAENNFIDFLDLTPYFESDYKKNKKEFGYKTDGHWNERAHYLVAEILTEYLTENEELRLMLSQNN